MESHPEVIRDEKPGLHQGSPNVKPRVTLRGDKPSRDFLKRGDRR
jgi:hypothetical protein